MASSAEDSARVLRRPALRRWEQVLLVVVVVAVSASWGVYLVRGSEEGPPSLPITAVIVVIGLAVLRPKRVELRDTEVVLRHALLTRRVPYADIVAVRGDVPARLEWSARLVLELRSGRTVWVPSTREPLDVVHDLIAERIDAAPAA
ncbi:hypothetical protein SAMN05216184_12211 [Georgenia satyanarayanai]|uniref:PH domain-containing protein n=1 Tax=Georgenia satyanarayanai TaxID=860221 RepID=A0A2Y9C7X3_9MICO|nr:hypothetical protein [Georgenia satyanarayanai]PYF96257.1 hypothetical protein A8987_12211 [Georgenia satyanarayanai]SSA47093.1 hypothetical protein SAMN05216184_12211 [Georgenia satyanarayanai]